MTQRKDCYPGRAKKHMECLNLLKRMLKERNTLLGVCKEIDAFWLFDDASISPSALLGKNNVPIKQKLREAIALSEAETCKDCQERSPMGYGDRVVLVVVNKVRANRHGKTILEPVKTASLCYQHRRDYVDHGYFVVEKKKGVNK